MPEKFAQLYEIAARCGTDKGHQGPSAIWSANNYTDIYQSYFGINRLKKINFCEIGLGVPGPNWKSKIAHGSNTGGGGSIKMWQEFFPNANLFGLDINPATHLDNDRVKTFVVDQGSKESLENFKSQTENIQFDIIIDDGSHIADHQQISLSLLWEKVAAGGFYIIEDLNDLRSSEKRHKKHAPKIAEPTRDLFEHFLRTGNIKEPNNFVNVKFTDELSYMAFHSFPVTQSLGDLFKEILRIGIGRGGRGLLRHQFRTIEPRMIVLQKIQ